MQRFEMWIMVHEVSGFLSSIVMSIPFPTSMNYNIVDNSKRVMKMAQMVAFMAIFLNCSFTVKTLLLMVRVHLIWFCTRGPFLPC